MKLLTLATLLVLLTSAALAAPDQAADKKSIRAYYDMLAKAYSGKDVDTLARLIAPDAKLSQGTQKSTGKALIAVTRQVLPTVQEPFMKVEVTSISISGNRAKVSRKTTSGGLINGPDNKKHKLAAIGTQKDVLVRNGKSWLLKEEASVTVQSTMDGHVMKPQGGQPH